MNSFLYTIFGLFCLLSIPSNVNQSQADQELSSIISPNSHYCAHSHAQELLFQEQPALEAFNESLEDDAYRFIDDYLVGTPRALETLPVVVHIIHNNGPENISDAAVLQGLDDVNAAFANLGYYDQNTGVDTDLQFCLAKRDPNGDATSGIVRVASTLTNMTMETEDLTVKDLSRWDPLQYINIWLVAEICSNSQGCGVAGYAYFPSSHGNPEDGVVIEAEWMGSSPANSSVLAHELGHYLGLYHTFENACTNADCLADGDRVCDTPPDQSTAAVPCDDAPNSCTTDVNAVDPNNPFTTDQNDMIINYMDYGDWNCYSAFTAGQADRMHFFAEGVRSSLLDSEACLDPCLSPITANFNPSTLSISTGGSVNFTNTSNNATTSNWLIDGTSFATTTNANYTFNNVGTFSITLEVGNNSPNCNDTYSVDIEVVCNTEATFTSSASNADLGESISFTNNSSNGQNYEWFVDGISQSTATDFSTSFVQAGVFEICLEVSGSFCNDTHCFSVIVTDIADDCSETFMKAFGNANVDEKAYSIAAAGDGTIYIGGSRMDSVLLMRMDAAGSLLWQRSFLFSNNGANILTDLRFDSDNNLIGCGLGDNGANDREGFVFRYDPTANNMIWTQNHQHASLNVSNYDIQELNADGNFMVTGQSSNNPPPGLGCDGYLFELDRNNGTITSVNEHYNLGSCETFQTAQFYNGSLYTGGRYNFAGGGTNKMRCAASRFDLAGNEIWTRLYLVDLVANARLYSTDLLVENDSIIQIHIGDKNGTSANNPEVFLSKANLNGEIDWAKEYSLTSGDNISLREIISIPNGYILLGLNTSEDKIFILKTDKDGNLIWAKNYGGTLELLTSSSGVEIVYANDYLYIAAYSSDINVGDDDIIILKVNMDGLINSTCIFIEDLSINVLDFPNPYDGLHPLTAYSSAIGGTNPIVSPVDTDINEEVICLSSCIEICDNGIDDDGDGLIDCYDPDCCETPECDDFYYTGCPADCSYDFQDALIILEVEWESSGAQDWCSYNTPITGDIDGDGVPEIIGKPCTGDSIPGTLPYPNLLIVDGATGNIEAVINTPAFYYLADGPAIADVDNNGYAEIFIMASDHVNNNNYVGGGPFINGNVARRVLCYEFNGSTYVEKWMSDEQAGYTDLQQAMSVSIADFNGDGIPELYLGSQIFNSLTGELIVGGGVNQHHGVKPIGDNASLSQALTVAVDVLPDEFCINCGGLELVAGGMVFSVNINPSIPANSMMNVEVILPNSLPNPPSNPNDKDGFTSIADIDKDGDLDAIITTTNENFGIIYAWDIQTTTLLYSEYLTPSTDEGFISQANIADFDGDGFPEIGVCSKEHYQVLKPTGNPIGGTLNTLWEIDSDDYSGSTGSAVFDFNNDGASEVVYRGETDLKILDGSSGVTLTSLPCASGTRVEYPVVVDVDADGETEILCSCASKLVSYGSAFIPWLNARSVWNQHNYFNININDDLTVPTIQQQHHIVGDSIELNNFLTMYADQDYLAADAAVTLDTVDCDQNGNLIATFEICNFGAKALKAETPVAIYENDPTSTASATLESVIDLGQILEIGDCIFIDIMVSIPNNGPLFIVVNDDGTEPPPFDLPTDFPVNYIAECDFTNNIAGLTDLIDFIPLDLGPDQQICENGVATLDAGFGFDQYEWSTLSTEQTITVSEEGIYYVTAYIGCFAQRDTLAITINPNSILSLGPDEAICTGESVTLSVLNDNFDEYQWYPSDFLDCDNCPTVVATPDGDMEYIIVGMTDDGCISSDTIAITVGFEVASDTMILCNGETVTIFGEIVSGNGTYTDTVFYANGCDTILTITTIELDPLSVDIASTGTCPEDNNGTATATVTGGVEPIQYNWNPFADNSPDIFDLTPGQYDLTVTDAENCSTVSSVLIETSPAVSVNFETQETSCYDSEDGLLLLDSSALGLQFSFDDVFYTPMLTFDELAVGGYTLYIQDELGCVHTQSFNITGPPPVLVLLPGDTTLRLGESIEINSITTISDTLTYQWMPPDFLDCIDCPEVISTPFETTVYTLMVTDTMGCSGVDTIMITVNKDRNVYIPNAFSPNFDGINDVIYIYSDIGVEEVVDFKIFSRWGELVFAQHNFPTNDPKFGWDGIFNGKAMNPGVFVYFAKIRFLDGEEILYSGDVSIVK